MREIDNSDFHFIYQKLYATALGVVSNNRAREFALSEKQISEVIHTLFPIFEDDDDTLEEQFHSGEIHDVLMKKQEVIIVRL